MLLGKIGGVRFRINLLFLLLGLLYTWMGFLREILLVFSAVFLHELAHLLTAYMLGIKIQEIVIWPFGGQARVEDFTALEPEKEILLALSGPLLSFSLAGIFYFGDWFANEQWRSLFVNINLLLGAFNSIPALPLDGGHVLQALLAGRIGYRRSNLWVSIFGQFIGVAMIAYGIYLTLTRYTGINILLVGVFLIWAAYRERKLLGYAFMRFLIRKKKELADNGFLPARQLVGTPSTLIKDLLKTVGPSNYLIVLVVDEQNQVVAMKSEAELTDVLLERGPYTILQDCLF